jgi:hypothetical protein
MVDIDTLWLISADIATLSSTNYLIIGSLKHFLSSMGAVRNIREIVSE